MPATINVVRSLWLRFFSTRPHAFSRCFVILFSSAEDPCQTTSRDAAAVTPTRLAALRFAAVRDRSRRRALAELLVAGQRERGGFLPLAALSFTTSVLVASNMPFFSSKYLGLFRRRLAPKHARLGSDARVRSLHCGSRCERLRLGLHESCSCSLCSMHSCRSCRARPCRSTAGVVAAAGDLRPPLVVAFAAAGAIAGDNTAYFVGRRFGTRISERFFSGEGRKRITWAHRQVQEARRPADRGRSLHPRRRRTVVTLQRGDAQYPWRRFIAFDVVAGVTWGLYAALLGYFGGHAFEGSRGRAAARTRDRVRRDRCDRACALVLEAAALVRRKLDAFDDAGSRGLSFGSVSVLSIESTASIPS